jgi:hypothetical protein
MLVQARLCAGGDTPRSRLEYAARMTASQRFFVAAFFFVTTLRLVP